MRDHDTGPGAAICVFADATTFGFTFVFGDPTTANRRRFSSGTSPRPIPPSPQPDAPQTDTGPDPQSESSHRFDGRADRLNQRAKR